MDIDYPPTSDGRWFGWGGNFSGYLVANAASLPLDPATIGDVEMAFNNYSNAYLAAIHADTRSRPTIALKDSTLAHFKETVKPVVGLLQASVAVTDVQRTQMGLKVRKAPTPKPIPDRAPQTLAMVTGPESARVIAVDPLEPNRRGKPAGVHQIVVLAYLASAGEQPPADRSQWPVSQLSSHKTIDLYWPNVPAGTTAHLACYYVNTRNQPGPISEPKTVNLPGTGTSAAATTSSDEDPTIKLAA